MPQTSHVETISLFEYLYRGWPLFLGVLGVMAWLLRLEAKVVYLEKYVTSLNDTFTKRDAESKAVAAEMAKDLKNILQHMSKMEGLLEGRNSNKP